MVANHSFAWSLVLVIFIDFFITYPCLIESSFAPSIIDSYLRYYSNTCSWLTKNNQDLQASIWEPSYIEITLCPSIMTTWSLATMSCKEYHFYLYDPFHMQPSYHTNWRPWNHFEYIPPILIFLYAWHLSILVPRDLFLACFCLCDPFMMEIKQTYELETWA